MTTFYTEVPAHVQHVNQVSNQVQVRGGTNWDLSRSAVATPITQLAEPAPVAPLPETLRPVSKPSETATVHFGVNSAVLPAAAQQVLKTVPKGVTVSVDGYAGPAEKKPQALASRRATEVAARLRKQGVKVDGVTGHPAADAADLPAAEQRKVDVHTK